MKDGNKYKNNGRRVDIYMIDNFRPIAEIHDSDPEEAVRRFLKLKKEKYQDEDDLTEDQKIIRKLQKEQDDIMRGR